MDFNPLLYILHIPVKASRLASVVVSGLQIPVMQVAVQRRISPWAREPASGISHSVKRHEAGNGTFLQNKN